MVLFHMTVRRSLCITSHARYLGNVWCLSRDTRPSRNRFICCHEDKIRILKSLRDIRDLLDRFNPNLTTEFSIKSLLTLVVENTFSEMRSGTTAMPLQLEFDYRFSRTIKERLN